MFTDVLDILTTALNAVFGWFSTLLSAIGFPVAMFIGVVTVFIFITRFVGLTVGSDTAKGKKTNNSEEDT